VASLESSALVGAPPIKFAHPNPDIWMGREGAGAPGARMLCGGVTNVYTSWQPKQQKFVATGYFWLVQRALSYSVLRSFSGVTSHRQPRQCLGARGPKTVKGAQSDPNYVSRLLLDCVPVFHKIITPDGGGPKIIVTPLRSLVVKYFRRGCFAPPPLRLLRPGATAPGVCCTATAACS